ncbi:uncharacterized protein LOC134253138 [Saccostrea cucullata]|uniref:uncharacterized protein LOC134228968 n=1 Tax=Saccostrea cuccullata TaxID=36930 RepID=UPI002ED13D85
MVLYNAVSQQKAIFVQSVQAFEKEVSNLRIKSVMSFRERVFKAVCKAKSPCVSIRYLQQHLKGSLSQNIRIELEHLERLGFGKLKALKTRQGKKDFFMKIHPNCIDEEIGEHQKMLTTAAISIENYRTNFNDDSTIGADVKAFLMQNHPQSEMIEFLW